MPRKDKEVLAKEKKAADDKLRNLPKHLRPRIGKPSRLSDAFGSIPNEYDWRGLKTGPDGNVGWDPNHGKAANKKRQRESLERAKQLVEKCSDSIWTREGPSIIAEAESISASTVRRARKLYKANEQAK